jgi:hypothetical protein
MVVDEPIFTAFGQANPDRIIVDLACRPGHLSEPIPVDDGLVREISLSPYATGSNSEMTRVEVLLDSPADFEVEPIIGGLSIRISEGLDGFASGSIEDSSMGEDADSFDPWAAIGSPAISDAGEVSGESGTSDVSESASLEDTPATKLTGVEVEETTDGILVQLLSDGAIASVMTFTLEDPSRLVIDLPDLANEASNENIELGSDRVERIRVGQHADKIRVVIDGGSTEEPFDGRRVVPTSAGLVIALGSGEEIDAALAMTTQPAPSDPPREEAVAMTTADEVEVASIDSEQADSDMPAEAAIENAESSDPWDSMDAWDSHEVAGETDSSDDMVETDSAEMESETAPIVTAELEPEVLINPVVVD